MLQWKIVIALLLFQVSPSLLCLPRHVRDIYLGSRDITSIVVNQINGEQLLFVTADIGWRIYGLESQTTINLLFESPQKGAECVVVEGERAYVGLQSGLEIYNVSSVSPPSLISTIPVTPALNLQLKSASIAFVNGGNRLVVANIEQGTTQDVYNGSLSKGMLYISDRQLLLVGSDNSVLFFDVNSSPILLATLQISGNPTHIISGAVDSSIVYVAAGNNIHAIDTVNSSRPILLFADQETNDIISLVASNKSKEGLTIFAGIELDGVTVYRAVDRSKLKWVGGIRLGDAHWLDLAFEDEVLLTADDVTGAIHLLDVDACYIVHDDSSSSHHKIQDPALVYGLVSAAVLVVFVVIFGSILFFMIRGMGNVKRKTTQRGYGAINTDDHSTTNIESTSNSKYDSKTDNFNASVNSKSYESIIEGDSE